VKIAIVNVQVPFVRGGAESLADSLAGRLGARGHAVEVIRIPFKCSPPRAVADQMLACRLLRVDAGGADRVVALKFPAYLVPFANKTVWLLHQFRQVYEQWDTPAGMPEDAEHRGLRDMIVRADDACLRQARRVFTGSKVVAGRLKRFNGIAANEVLYPPPAHPELFRPGEFGDYFFCHGRQNAAGRQRLAVEAMRYVRSPFRLVLAGAPDSEGYGQELGDKVVFLGCVSEEEKARRMSEARAVLDLSHDEDCCVYATLEAFHCHKPVVTLSDSVGANELIEDGRNGLVVEPSPQALAEALEALYADRGRARELGRAGHDTLAERRIDWDFVLDRLTAA